MRVIVSGRLKQRSYETKEGEKRTVFEVEVDEVGPSLRNATAKVTKTARAAGTGNTYSAAAGSSQSSSTDDPWSAAPVGGGWSTTPSDDAPPF
jgi:single-strand DNA-binding protein